jgi:N-methylhydantoinase A
MEGALRVGADVGGTFTDVLALDPDGRVRFRKLLSTPPDYGRAVLDAVSELGSDSPPGFAAVVHGTTVATNAVLERRGARTALVTTAGFRDVLELRRIRTPHLYDYFWTKPSPLVPRHLRFEVAERVTATGEVLTPLDEEEAGGLADSLRELDLEAVAVCLLHAHVYPAHERRLGAVLRAALPGVPITLSSDVLREQQEYERTATTVVNAYVRPLMERYLGQLRRGLDEAGIAAPLTIMQSSGGVMSADDCARRPVYALESGPAAGVVAGAALAGALGLGNVITFDMGGTTAKASLIEDGAVSRSVEYEVGAALSAGSRLLRGSGELIRIPTLDIAEVGAGGGSIAWVDPAGALHVGPTSAGADRVPPATGSGARTQRSPTRTSSSATSRPARSPRAASRSRAGSRTRRSPGSGGRSASTRSGRRVVCTGSRTRR